MTSSDPRGQNERGGYVKNLVASADYSPQLGNLDSHSLSSAIFKPTRNDLIPTDHARSCNKEAMMDHDNALSTSKLGSSSKEMGSSSHSELLGANATTSTAQESLPLVHTSTSVPRSSSHPLSTPTRTVSGIKRRREIVSAKGSLHKPFKSPVRSLAKDTASPPKKQLRVSTAGSALQSSGANSASPAAKTTAASQPLMHGPASAAFTTKSRNSRISTQGKRVQFRSPFAREPNSQPSGDTALSRLMQLQTLNARVTELQSTVRKAKQVIQLQQKRDDTPLVDLIEKWKRASQEGAQVLLETYMTHEQVLGPWGNDTGWSKSIEAPPRQCSMYVGGGTGGSQSPHCLTGMDRERLDKQLEAEEARLEMQDVQQDLPTVDEAIRTKSWPDVGPQPPVTMTKMQSLLLRLGVNPVVIGYDQDQDAFTSEELPYDN
ncbi:hypothetical protein BGZ72_007292 [Mortierella alpina]|nr:hypothetical protein BGZ72_007292 [Mortierella alpina]